MGLDLMSAFRIILLISLVVCAVATAFSKRVMTALIIFTSYSIIMSVVWLLLRAPDLAITEAAVGAGVDGILFFITLRKLHLIDKDNETSSETVKGQQVNSDEE